MERLKQKIIKEFELNKEEIVELEELTTVEEIEQFLKEVY